MTTAPGPDAPPREPLHRFEFTFDQDFVRLGLRRARRRAILFGVLAMVLAGVLLALVTQSSVTYLLVVCSLGALAVALSLVFKFHRAGKVIYELWRTQSPDHTLTYELDDEGFTVRTNRGSSRYAWTSIHAFARDPRVWHIEVTRGVSVYFPPDALSAEARDFLVARCTKPTS